MKKTSVIIDSTAYIPKEYVEAHSIRIVPLTVELDGKLYKEGMPGEYKSYFDSLKNSETFPKTSQPSVGDFTEAYEKAFADGAEELLVMTFSSALSGTHNSAQLAAQDMKSRKIIVVDTLTAAGIFSYIVRESVKMIEKGLSLEEIEENIRDIQKRSNIDLTVETIEFLKRGGRLTNIQAMIAGVLNIKPVISLIDGKLVGNGKFRGKKKAIKEIISRIPENPVNIAIHHVESLEEAESIRTELSERFPDADLVVEELGPVIGSHLGPGGVGICTVYKK